jgi:sensor histidine kinase YesM
MIENGYSIKNIWIGAYQGGLYKYNGKQFVDLRKLLSLKTNAYLAITEDKIGNLYIGTFDGIYIYNGKKIRVINESDGLNSDLIYNLLLDDHDSTLWVGTNQGINKIDISNYNKYGLKKIHTFGKQEGFSGVECNINGVYKDYDHSIWFGTVNGLVKFDRNYYKINSSDSKPIITNILLFDKDTTLTQGALLPYNQNHITFQFRGISLTDPSKVKYRYKLEGYDTYWSHASTYNIASYTSLPSRKYNFQVFSCNSEGVWTSKPASFSFTIEHPWWRKPIFRLMFLAVFVLIIYFIFKLRLRQLRLKERNRLNQKIQVVKYELKALRSQMNPHFIFNSMNAIQHFISKSNTEEASKYLNKLAKLMRMILINSEKALITVKEELDALKLYIDLEKLRFGDKFDYKIIVDDVDEDFIEIPSMLLQPYTENAIMHGLTPKQKGGYLEIKIKQVDKFLVCTITDNGIGRAKAAEIKANSISIENHVSMGMSITEGRLQMLNNLHNSNLSVIVNDLKDEKGLACGRATA